MVKRKETNNDKQTITQKTKDRATRYPLKTGSEPKWPGRVSNSFSTCGTRSVTLVTNPVMCHEGGKECVFDKRNISVSKSINLTHIYMTHHFLVCVCVWGRGPWLSLMNTNLPLNDANIHVFIYILPLRKAATFGN